MKEYKVTFLHDQSVLVVDSITEDIRYTPDQQLNKILTIRAQPSVVQLSLTELAAMLSPENLQGFKLSEDDVDLIVYRHYTEIVSLQQRVGAHGNIVEITLKAV